MTIKKLSDQPAPSIKPAVQPTRPGERSPVSYGFEFAFGFWFATFIIFAFAVPALGCILSIFLPGLIPR